MKRIICVILSLFVLYPAFAEFHLVSPEHSATILVDDHESSAVLLAVQDLVQDVNKIARRDLQMVTSLEDCAENTLVIATADQPSGERLSTFLPEALADLQAKWETYIVKSVQKAVGPVEHALVIGGSNELGTIFGIYAFCEQYLGVDPLYFWSGLEPQPRDRLEWDSVSIKVNEPTYRFRGWFLNDEDLLVNWKRDGGKRHIAYPHYHQVTSPWIYERVYESMLRLRMNMVIPASFNDILNHDEERAIRMAAERGLFVSMHHIEPLGVSGFAFSNYWKYRGGAEFSIVKFPEKFKEVWTVHAKKWAEYPKIIWQLGLRGIADRPVWASDPSVPDTDAGRGKLISDAIATQWDIVKSVTGKKSPMATTTLWMEGAKLHLDGHLQFPQEVAVIFADNSPGWTMQADFYNVERQKETKYGIYYHHALWGSGPHFVQAVSPKRAFNIFLKAHERSSSYYGMMNVSNIRPFLIGLDASSRFMWDIETFQPDPFLTAWCETRFGATAPLAKECYELLFDSYVTESHIMHSLLSDNEQNLPFLLDGQTLHKGERLFSKLLTHVKIDNPVTTLYSPTELDSLIAAIERQKNGLVKAELLEKQVHDRLTGQEQRLFELNFMAQRRIMLGLLNWLQAGAEATIAFQEGNRQHGEQKIHRAIEAFEMIRDGQAFATQGLWKDWYYGDRKMNLGRAEHITREVARSLEN